MPGGVRFLIEGDRFVCYCFSVYWDIRKGEKRVNRRKFMMASAMTLFASRILKAQDAANGEGTAEPPKEEPLFEIKPYVQLMGPDSVGRCL